MGAPNMLAAALVYADRSWHVFPIRPILFTDDGPRCSCRDGIGCGQLGKHPAVLWRNGDPADPQLWKRPATTDAATIGAWWARWPSAGIGIATGLTSGIVVIDVDKYADGYASLAALDERRGWQWSTARVLTPTGGAHFYYRCPPGGLPTSTSSSRSEGGRVDPLGSGIDVRGCGGMVVAPPSMHRCAGRYAWQHDVVTGGDQHVVDLP